MKAVFCLPFAVAIGCAPGGDAAPRTEPAASSDAAAPGAAAGPVHDYGSGSLVTGALRMPDDGAARDALEVALTNRSDVQRDAWLEIAGHGLASALATRSYAVHTLAPHETKLVAVPAGELPLQSAAMPVTIVVGVSFAKQDGGTGRAIAGSVLARATGDYQRVVLSSANAAFEHRAELGSGDGRVARMFDARARGFVDLDASALAVGEHAQVVSVTSDPEAEVARAPAVELAPEPQSELVDKASSTRFCVNVRYTFDDAGFGEDRLAAFPAGTVRAAHAKARVRRGSTTLFDAHLDGNGCTPSLGTSTAGDYTVRLTSQLSRSGKHIQIRDNLDDSTVSNWDTTVRISASTSSTMTVAPSVPFDYGNAIALTSTALSVLPQAIIGTFHVLVNQGCSGTNDAFDACFSPGFKQLKIGLNQAGQRLITKKFVIAHELGHGVQSGLFGLFGGGYSPNPPVDTVNCNCNHVDSANKLHCLQGRELVGPAAAEGFAHYYAARLFNALSPTECTFTYYKEVRWNVGPDPAGSDPTICVEPDCSEPPVAISCASQWALNRDLCGDDPMYPDTGTEADWLMFLWSLTTQGPAPIEFSELVTLLRGACNRSCISSTSGCASACLGRQPDYWDLEAAAMEFYGWNSPGHNQVLSAGLQHGMR
jgi:hypothetical protein